MKKIFLYVLLISNFSITSFGQPVDKQLVYKDAINWYSFDNDGTDSIGVNDLKLNHVNFMTDDIRGKVAVINHADTGYMEFAKPAITSEQFTITTWFYFYSSYKDWWQTIFEFANDVNNNNFYFCPNLGSLGVVSENKVESKWQSVGSDPYQTPVDQWVHLAMSFDNGKVCIYADGVLVGSGNFTNTIAGLALNRFFIGANPLPGRFYKALDAKYDDFAVFNKALNDLQINAIAHDTLPTPPDVKPYVFETEDYIFGDWKKGTDGDITFGYYPAVPDSPENTNNSLLYGVIEGQGQISVWARVKSEVKVVKPFIVKIDDEPFIGCDSIMPSSDWEWVLLQRIASSKGNSHTLKIAPAATDLKVDKFLATYNWDYNPNIDYTKIDNSSPTMPANYLVKGTTEYTSQLSWNSSTDNEGITGYDIMDGDKVLMVTTDTTAKPVIQASTVYNFSIRAKDAAGNLSAKTTSVSVTAKDIVFTADFSVKKQIIHHFGSSDAWATEFIGKWPDVKRDSLTKLLFSSKLDATGSPEGIALSNWRYRIGDGSRDQSSNGLSAGNWFKATQCFLKSDGSYDWTKQAGNVWFMKKAKAYGVPHFTGWTDSPPFFMTKSGYVFRVTGSTVGYNLKSDKYTDFANYLAEVANHFESEGIALDIISPVNEPQWGWDYKVGEGGQPGSSCSNTEMANLIKAINTSFVANNVKSKILISEAGAIDYLYSAKGGGADNQIYNFWNQAGSNYIGDLPSLSNYVAGHGYFTETTVSGTINTRQSLLAKLQNTNTGLEYWQTEYSLLSDGYAKEKAIMTPMDYSLFIARVIHYDLTVANCTGWDWWSTFSRPWGEDHKYRFALINWYPNVDNDNCSDGTFELTKNFWVLGNYSHFVRPGYQRVGSSRSDFLTPEQSSNKQLISSFISPNADTAVFVVINYAEFDQQISLGYKNLPDEGVLEKMQPYVTSASDNLKAYPEVEASSKVTVKARSVTTFVGKIKKNGSGIIDNKNNSLVSSVSIYPNPASDMITISIVNGNGQHAELFDLAGKMVGSYRLTDNKVTINLNNINPGCYFISVYYNSSIKTEKLIISK
jgi:O-glycosyl hydrolase